MRLHMFRHGLSVPSDDPAFPDDAQRPLTDEGRKRTRLAAKGIATLGLEPEAILASPLVRAQQTAEIAAETLDLGEVETLATLRPTAAPADTRQGLAQRDPTASLLLVGHLPHAPKLAAYLLTGQAEALDMRLGKAGLWSLEIALQTPEAHGRLDHLLQPATLEALGRGR